MNAFEKFEDDRSRRRQNIIQAWIQFRAALIDSVATYNRMEEGIAHPAEITETPEKNFVTVNCKRPSSTRGIGLLSIILRVGVTDKRVAIWAVIEFWQLVNDAPSSSESQSFEFVVEPEPESQLSFEGARIAPAEAADLVLMKALLGLPPRTESISAVVKRNRDAA